MLREPLEIAKREVDKMSDEKNLFTAKTALAGGLIASAILDALYKKGVLDLGECREVLTSAMNAAGHVSKTPEAVEAQRHIAWLMRETFSERPKGK